LRAARITWVARCDRHPRKSNAPAFAPRSNSRISDTEVASTLSEAPLGDSRLSMGNHERPANRLSGPVPAGSTFTAEETGIEILALNSCRSTPGTEASALK